jgi:DNA-binding transcriptional LysR family regulator
MLELRHLRYFVAVAEERNISRAAERLHMAQSPLSAAIRQLEQEIGGELLARSSRGVTLTPPGEVLLGRARRVLEEIDGAVAATRRAAKGELGTLRIGYSWGTRFETVPTLAQEFTDSQPDVTLLTQEMWNADMPGALRSATIDLAIGLCPERDGQLAYELLRRERMVVLVPADHRLANRGEADLSELADETFLLFPRELAPRLYDTMRELCRSSGFEPKVSRRAIHSAGDTGTIASARAVALAPESARGAMPGTAAVLLAGQDVVVDTYMMWQPATSSAAAERFRGMAARRYFTAR